MEAVGFRQDFREAKQEMQVLGGGRERERIDREGAFFNADRKVSTVKEPGQILVAAAQVKDVGERRVLLNVRQKKIRQEALSAAARAKDGGVGNILIMQVQKIRGVLLGLESRQVFRTKMGVFLLPSFRPIKKGEIGVIGVEQIHSPEVVVVIPRHDGQPGI
jgi:hypothetical protein